MFAVKETNLVTGTSRNITNLVRTSRGYHREEKTFKTESSAKAWIKRRMNELSGTDLESRWSYEVVESYKMA